MKLTDEMAIEYAKALRDYCGAQKACKDCALVSKDFANGEICKIEHDDGRNPSEWTIGLGAEE